MIGPESKTKSFWLHEALSAEDADVHPLDSDLRTDVCVVGGGYTGLWTALRLKELEPGLDVTVIEADLCGSGASGRNGGFVMTWMSKALTLLAVCGGQEGGRLLRESEHAVLAIARFCAEHGIDAQLRHDGWLWTASNRAQMHAWAATVEALARLGLEPFEILEPAEVVRRTGSDHHVGGVYERGVATVQPALLARGLRRVAIARGVRVHERTPMTGLVRATPPEVRTSGGRIRADTVVLALNAWAHQLPEFRRSILPLAADVVITEALPERLAALGLADGRAVSDSRLLVNYYRTTPDGRLCFGKGGGAIAYRGRLGSRMDGATPRRAEVREEMVRFYPSLADARIDAAWQGPATRTATGLPFFGRLPGCEGIVYGHGYTGNGVGPSYLGGRILASLALRRDDEWSQTPLVVARPAVFMPPEPFRYLGGRLVRRAARRKDRAEDEGRVPGRLDRALAGLAPKGLAPVAKS